MPWVAMSSCPCLDGQAVYRSVKFPAVGLILYCCLICVPKQPARYLESDEETSRLQLKLLDLGLPSTTKVAKLIQNTFPDTALFRETARNVGALCNGVFTVLRGEVSQRCHVYRYLLLAWTGS